MSAGKHTPGEWHWDHDVLSSSTDSVVLKRWRVVTRGKTITQIYRDDEHAEADCRLIAAAPELLEALKDLSRGYVNMLESARERIISFGGDCDPVSVMERADPRLAAARTIIAKAEGRS